MAYDAYGNTWFGGHALARWNEQLQLFDTVIYVYGGPMKYKDDIVALTADEKGSLWMHNPSSGLLEYKIKEKQFVFYDGIQYGLGSVVIQSLANKVNDKLWYTTGTRLGCFDIPSHTAITFKQQDGIPEERPTARKIFYDARNNSFYSLHENRFVKFSAAIPQSNISDTSFMFTAITSAGHAVYFPAQQIKLNASTRDFHLHYTVLDYDNAESITFYYKINEGEWISNENKRVLDFYRLKPGAMQVSVRAIGKFGQELRKDILIKIAYPLWQRWWFIASVVLLIIALGYMLYRYRINEIKKLFTVRSRISQDLHDELGATLSGISMYSHLAKSQLQTDKNAAAYSLNVMQQSANEMVEKLNDIVWLTNPLHDSLQEMLDKLYEYAHIMAGAAGMQVVSNFNAFKYDLKMPMDTRRNMYLICKEVINNAVKYSRANQLQLHIARQQDDLVISIQDNGQGFNSHDIKTGNGLVNISKRAEESGLELQIQSREGQGCNVLLRYNITH